MWTVNSMKYELATESDWIRTINHKSWAMGHESWLSEKISNKMKEVQCSLNTSGLRTKHFGTIRCKSVWSKNLDQYHCLKFAPPGKSPYTWVPWAACSSASWLPSEKACSSGHGQWCGIHHTTLTTSSVKAVHHLTGITPRSPESLDHWQTPQLYVIFSHLTSIMKPRDPWCGSAANFKISYRWIKIASSEVVSSVILLVWKCANSKEDIAFANEAFKAANSWNQKENGLWCGGTWPMGKLKVSDSNNDMMTLWQTDQITNL